MMAKTASKKPEMPPLMIVDYVHLLPLISTGMYTSAAIVAYAIALGMDHVEPIFPFISHALAYPPQSALGIIFGTPAAFLAILSFIVRYVVTDHRARALLPDNTDSIKSLNKAALFCGIVSNISALIVMLNPVGFPWHERSDMVLAIGIPHHVGAFAVLIFFTAYVFIQAYLSYSQRSLYKENVFLQLALLVGVIISITGILLTVYSALTEIFHSLIDERTGIVHFIYKKYSVTAATCAVSEWSFVGMCLIFVATFYRDFKNVKIKFHLKSKQ